jgi:hypothetical protein
VRPRKMALLFEEEHLRRFLRHFEVDCVFDVGANSGQYATMVRERAGYLGPIVSFEPNQTLESVHQSPSTKEDSPTSIHGP